ncbi:MAG: F0F1 ATP synthase subunit delta [Psychrobacillus psychrotolerans]|uniref:ATP synthase subunit delta n=1 Tax=Psychrobacillus psychrotolerans TaxID=126156 RepID=A0A1I6BDM5_9BACI|nr:F0F1 ATP synthase subunit delta [Psychrobacillus psychrotolerans]SFQ78989.1 ATP synthase F1 subcomplex delta subunit [Psychrobacillus psychrotolerans]
MSNSTVAKRYAISLFELATQKNVVQAVENDLRELKVVWNGNKDVKTLFTSPKLSLDKKKELIRQIFTNANPIVINTLLVLIDKKRLAEVSDIISEFMILSNEAQGVAEAKVYTTRALTEEERANVSTAFAKNVGKQSLNIQNIVDPSIIGGIRVQIGNRIYDSTLSTKLDRLKRNLIG